MALRATNSYVEAITIPESKLRITNSFIETITDPDPKARLSNFYLEILFSNNPKARLSNFYIEVITPNINFIERTINDTLTFNQTIDYEYLEEIIEQSLSNQLEFTDQITVNSVRQYEFVSTIILDSSLHYIQHQTHTDISFSTPVSFHTKDTLLIPIPKSFEFIPLETVFDYSNAYLIRLTWDTDRKRITDYFRRYRNHPFEMRDQEDRRWLVMLRIDNYVLKPHFRPEETEFTLEFNGTRL